MSKPDIYTQVTNQIIADLENGVTPWAKPWTDAKGIIPADMPKNGQSGKDYSGINILLLWASAWSKGYGTGTWLTFKQCKALGGSVIKGEKATTVVYADRFVTSDEKKAAKEEGRAAQTIPFLKRYSVFNAKQCEDLPDHFYNEIEPVIWEDAEPECERIVKQTGAALEWHPSRCFYKPSSDVVHMVPPQQFAEPMDYYRTLFHELTHWTGHRSREDRLKPCAKGGPDYAFEELVAELGAAFISARLGLPPVTRHADYIGSWLNRLKSDKRFIFRAASLASRAADRVMGAGEIAPPVKPQAPAIQPAQTAQFDLFSGAA